MARSKLRERLATAAGLAVISEEPHVTIPPIDRAEALADVANRGYAATAALVEERNDMVKMAASVHRQNVHVLNTNNALRARCDYLERRCEMMIRSNATQAAYMNIIREVFQKMDAEQQALTGELMGMPKPPHVTNQPEMPECNAQGIPIEDEERDQFDANGIPITNGARTAPQPTLKELTEQIAALEPREVS